MVKNLRLLSSFPLSKVYILVCIKDLASGTNQ